MRQRPAIKCELCKLMFWSVFAASVLVLGHVAIALSTAQYQGTPSKSNQDGATVSEVYEGTLPCADCEGLKTILTLYSDAKTKAPKSYKLSETYLTNRAGKHNFVTLGQWTILRGTPTNPDATLYQLNPEKSGSPRSFLVVGDNQLKQLGQDLQEIQSNLNFTLTKRGATVPGGYSITSITDKDVVSAANFAVEQQQQKTGQPLSLVSVTQAQQQVVAGKNYKLCMKIKDGSNVRTASAVVYRNLQRQNSLTSWTWDSCP
jgi:copper homeostasis protein (lipoprotein)